MATDPSEARSNEAAEQRVEDTPPVTPSATADTVADDRASGDRSQGDDSAVGGRIFQSLAGFFVVLAVVYALTSDGEYAGVALLALAAGLSLMTGGFLEYAQRHGLRQELDPEDYERPDDLYLPHASLWPFVMGGGITLLAAGLPLGIWVLMPGGLLLGYGLVGSIQESRIRH